ncbi:MAG: hypothetical protein OHK0045_20810 [Raineya sp.]
MMFIFVKAVGLAPVFLAFFSLLFLVSLLSYHTIRKSFEQLELDRKKFIEVGRQLYATAVKVINMLQNKGDFLNNYDKILSLAGNLYSQENNEREVVRANILLKQELEILPVLVSNVSELAENRAIQEALAEMQEAEKLYQFAYNKYAYNLKYYNAFIEKLPSKWVAQVVGYKKQ